MTISKLYFIADITIDIVVREKSLAVGANLETDGHQGF